LRTFTFKYTLTQGDKIMINTIVLAAGEGTRMKSKFSKSVHKVAGAPIIDWVVSAVEAFTDGEIVCVVGKNGDEINEVLGGRAKYAIQEKRLGTGHAAMQAKKMLKEDTTLVIGGDSPLITAKTLERAYKTHQKSGNTITVLTAKIKNPTGYGRIICDGEKLLKIVEEKDATTKEKKIDKVNSGIYFFDTKFLKSLEEKISNHNSQGEFYLTDSIEIAHKEGKKVAPYLIEDEREILGVNNRHQLSHAEKILRNRIILEHMEKGVTFINPKATYVSKDAQIGMDTTIYPNTIIEGKTKIGADCTIIGGRIKDSTIGNGCTLEQSVVLEAKIGHGTNIGPFAYIRPKSVIGNGNKVGSFVETKNSNIGNGTKLPHLIYVGDSDIGEHVNFGCGSLIANYDGSQKYRSTVGDEAFIGCNVNLISPVNVGEKAYIAAGTTVTKNVPEEALAIGRSYQENKEGWNKKKELEPLSKEA